MKTVPLDLLKRVASIEDATARQMFIDGLTAGLGMNGEDELVVASKSTLTPTPTPLQQPLPLPATPHKVAYHMPNRGIRANILRLLASGPANCKGLCCATEMQRGKISKAIAQLLDTEMVTEMPMGPGQEAAYSLTTKGRAESAFFIQHPELKTKPTRGPRIK